jgi:hypothetical protein
MLQAPVPPPVLPTAPATDTTTVQTQVQTQTVQPNVDPNDWFAAYFKKVKIDTEMGALAQPLQSGAPQAFPSDVDVDMESPPAPENAALLDSEVGQMSTAAFLASSTFQTSLMTAQVNELPSNMPRLKDSRWATTGAGSTLTTTAPFTIDWGTAPVQPAAPSGWNATITYNTMSATNLAHTYNPTPAHKTEPSRDLSTSFNAATNGTAPRRLLKDSRWAC